MIVEVTKENVIITQGSVINTNEIGVNICEFVLPECFDGLKVTAVFNGVPVPLTDARCWVPSLEKGNAVLGVYAYREDEGKVELMYSPRPAAFSVSQGSFCEAVNEEMTPSISEYEQYCRMLIEKSSEIFNDKVVPAFDPDGEPDENQVYSAMATLEMLRYVMQVLDSMLSDVEKVSNKATEITENSTDAEYASAKAVYDFGNQWYQAVKGDLDELSLLIGEGLELPDLEDITKPLA